MKTMKHSEHTEHKQWEAAGCVRTCLINAAAAGCAASCKLSHSEARDVNWFGFLLRNRWVFHAHQSCFNTRSQTLNKEYDKMTKCNQTVQPDLLCFAFQAPCGSARSSSVNVSQRPSIEMSHLDVFIIIYHGLIEWKEEIKARERKEVIRCYYIAA